MNADCSQKQHNVLQVVYICAVGYNRSGNHIDHCRRFIDTYKQYPAGISHDLVVIVNGAKIDKDITSMFSSVNCTLYQGDNVGWDIGGYIKYAQDCPRHIEALVCFGSMIKLKKANWLKRIHDVISKYGPGCYGLLSNSRSGWMRSRAFVIQPFILRTYPIKVASRHSRREFEDGMRSILWWSKVLKCKSYLITWSRVFETNQNDPVNGWWNGNHKEILVIG